MLDDVHESKVRTVRRWLAAGVVGLGLIAAGCNHGTPEVTAVERVVAGGEHRGGERSEGGGEHGGGEGSEGGGEHGGGEASEAGEEDSPTIPIDQIASGTFNMLDYTIAYDPAMKEFRGVVENNTSRTVCAARVEVHMSANGQVVELGPTPRVDLAPGEAVDVVLPAGAVTPDAYSAHAESSPCP